MPILTWQRDTYMFLTGTWRAHEAAHETPPLYFVSDRELLFSSMWSSQGLKPEGPRPATSGAELNAQRTPCHWKTPTSTHSVLQGCSGMQERFKCVCPAWYSNSCICSGFNKMPNCNTLTILDVLHSTTPSLQM